MTRYNLKVKDFLLKLTGLLFKNFLHLIAGTLLLIVFGLGYQMFRQYQALTKAQTDLVGQKDSYEQLSASYAKLGTDYVSAKALADQAKKDWQRELTENKKLKDQLRGIATATFSVTQPPVTGAPDKLVPGPDGYLYQEVTYLDAKGKVGPPVGYVRVANQTGVVTSKLFNHDVQIDSAIAVDDKTGKVTVYSKGFYILREPSLADTDSSSGKSSWKDVRYPLSITGGSLIFTPGAPPVSNQMPNRMQWATHLNAGSFGGVNAAGFEWGAHADITLAGYGKTKNDLDYKLLGFGVNANKDYLDFNVVPAYWRLANVLPLVSNVYVGPGVGVGSKGTSYFLTIGGTL